ncbi:MAG: hypothetical protein WBL74_02565, partial [Novosphingobium sp.]|uniref:hypothetical protein n=1 Tax=Novosphingobium sp. TaxID=1874826 RepID=UPI003C7B43F2
PRTMHWRSAIRRFQYRWLIPEYESRLELPGSRPVNPVTDGVLISRPQGALPAEPVPACSRRHGRHPGRFKAIDELAHRQPVQPNPRRNPALVGRALIRPAELALALVLLGRIAPARVFIAHGK